MKYRTKPVDPVVVDAFKYNRTLSIPALDKDFNEETDAPEWVVLAFLHKEMYYAPTNAHGGKTLYAKNSDGDMEIQIGSYIVRTEEGEIFGCPAEVFEEHYEKIPLVQEYKPIRRVEEMLSLNESELSELTPEEIERIGRVKKIPEHIKEGYTNIRCMLNREVIAREKLMDAISDYLEGFTEGVKLNE